MFCGFRRQPPQTSKRTSQRSKRESDASYPMGCSHEIRLRGLFRQNRAGSDARCAQHSRHLLCSFPNSVVNLSSSECLLRMNPLPRPVTARPRLEMCRLGSFRKALVTLSDASHPQILTRSPEIEQKIAKAAKGQSRWSVLLRVLCCLGVHIPGSSIQSVGNEDKIYHGATEARRREERRSVLWFSAAAASNLKTVLSEE